jgi:hypothetical protein
MKMLNNLHFDQYGFYQLLMRHKEDYGSPKSNREKRRRIFLESMVRLDQIEYSFIIKIFGMCLFYTTKQAGRLRPLALLKPVALRWWARSSDARRFASTYIRGQA